MKGLSERTRSFLLADLPEMLSSLVEDVQVSAVDEESVALAPGGLFKDAEVDRMAQ